MTPGQSPGSPNDGNALEQSMFKKALNDSIRDGLGPVRPIKLRIVRSTVDKSRRVPTSAGDCRGVSGCRGVGSTGRCRGRTDGSPPFGVLEPAAISRHWGNLVNDAHLVALAIEHHGQIVSFNRDFGRLGGVRWEMPPALTWAPNRRKADGANPVAQERRTVGYRSPRKPGWRNWQTRGA